MSELWKMTAVEAVARHAPFGFVCLPQAIAAIVAQHASPLHELGAVGGERLIIRGAAEALLIDESVSELRTAWSATIPAIAGA